MDAFADALGTLFDDPHLAEDATWSAGGLGPGVPIRVVRRSPDRIERFGDSRALLGSFAVDVRQSEVPTLAKGDTIEIRGALYQVATEPVGDGLHLLCAIELSQL